MARKKASKRKLVGFTKVGKSYALVFKSGVKKPVLGATRYRTKTSLSKAAKRYLK